MSSPSTSLEDRNDPIILNQDQDERRRPPKRQYSNVSGKYKAKVYQYDNED